MNDYTDLILQAVATPVERETEDEEQKHLRYYAEVPSDRQPTQSKLRLRVVVKYVYPSEWGHQRTGLISSAYLVRLR